MKIFLVNLMLIFTLSSCSNTPDMETGELRTLKLFKQVFEQPNHPKQFVDSRTLIGREQIDAAKTPVLFIELKSGQNGTLTPYPGQGIGEIWLGADGATVTLDGGILKATRGMGDDMMGSYSFIPPWSKINSISEYYGRNIGYIKGNNKISKRKLKCIIKKYKQQELHEIWGLQFRVTKFEETCEENGFKIKNIYYVDNQEIVRKSLQYHSETIGYISTERLDR